MDDTTWAALGGGVGGVILKTLTDFIINFANNRHKAKIEDREQISKEYLQLIDQCQRRLDQVTDGYRAQIAQLEESVRQIQKDRLECRLENESLRIEVRALQKTVEHLEQRLAAVSAVQARADQHYPPIQPPSKNWKTDLIGNDS